MQPAVKNCHRWIKEGSAAEERGTIDKQTTNTRSPKLVDTLEQLIGHASFDSAENLLAVIGIINQLRAGA